MAFPDQAAALREASERYGRYVRPLEETHRGQYVAVAPDGSLVLAWTLGEAVRRAEQDLVPESIVFKIGDVAAGSWR